MHIVSLFDNAIHGEGPYVCAVAIIHGKCMIAERNPPACRIDFVTVRGVPNLDEAVIRESIAGSIAYLLPKITAGHFLTCPDADAAIAPTVGREVHDVYRHSDSLIRKGGTGGTRPAMIAQIV